MIEGATPDLPRNVVRLRRGESGVELHFPPLRDASVAAPLAAFGLIAFALSAFGAGVMFSGAQSGTAGLLAAVLMFGFVAPIGVFGVIFVAQAVYMVSNALDVRVDAEGIETRRSLSRVVVARRRVSRIDLAGIAPQIASRHQSLFSAEPIYLLLALDGRGRRIVVAESLRGEALMTEVKALVERAAELDTATRAA